MYLSDYAEVRKLVSGGGKVVNYRGHGGWTPLMIAVAQNKPSSSRRRDGGASGDTAMDIVTELLTFGALVTANSRDR